VLEKALDYVTKVGVLGEASHRASHHLCEEACAVMHASLFIFILHDDPCEGLSPGGALVSANLHKDHSSSIAQRKPMRGEKSPR
jgi:hypothetical protein